MATTSSTAETPVRHAGGALLLVSSIVAALGSFLFGFDTAVISGTTEALRNAFNLSENLLGFTVSSALIGTMVGSLFVGRPADWWGRRKLLWLLAFLFVIASVGCALAWNWYALLGARWLGGVAVGAASVVCPMYITEIAPAHRRGFLVTVSQLNIVVGILAAYFSNFLVAHFVGANNPQVWRWMFGVMLLPSAAFLVTAAMIPESPRWLVKKGRPEEARQVLMRFGHAAPDQELLEIESTLRVEMGGLQQTIFQKKYLRPLLLACVIAVFNQFDGINAVIYYTADIFRMAGATETSALMQSVIVGLTNLVMTVVAMALIDRLGRKPLLLIGAVMFVVFHGLAAWVFARHIHGWIVLATMMGIVGTHAYSQGAVIWVVINELLPNAVRASGSAIACFVLWICCGAIAWSFPVVAARSGAYAFGFFGFMMAIMFVVVLKYFPETKGISLEELQKRLGVED